MKKKTSRKMLDRSCAWIRDHWCARNLDVPPEFLEQWIYEQSENESDAPGFHLAVFAFGFLQHDLIASQVPNGIKRSFSASVIMDRFSQWQLKLALAEIHHRTDMKSQPLPLFAFPEEEKIEFWRAATGSN